VPKFVVVGLFMKPAPNPFQKGHLTISYCGNTKPQPA
jgi:hypothetical protein